MIHRFSIIIALAIVSCGDTPLPSTRDLSTADALLQEAGRFSDGGAHDSSDPASDGGTIPQWGASGDNFFMPQGKTGVTIDVLGLYLASNGGSPIQSVAIASGSLPKGLSLDTDGSGAGLGYITGDANDDPGDYRFTLAATNAVGTSKASAEFKLNIWVSADSPDPTSADAGATPVADADISPDLRAPSQGVFFFDGFESGDRSHSENGFFWRVPKNVSYTTARPKSGRYSAAFFFPAKGGAQSADAHAEARFDLGANYPELWIQYDVYIPTNYEHRNPDVGASNNKWFYIWPGPDSAYSLDFVGPGLSIQNWSSGVKGEETGDTDLQLKRNVPTYAASGVMKEVAHFGNSKRFIGDNERGKWIKLRIHVKQATAANNDGVFEVWKIVDGQLILGLSYKDLPIYVQGQEGFRNGYLFGWANSGFKNDTTLYVDNVEFSTQPFQ